MESAALIDIIKTANKIEDVLDINNIDKEYKTILMQIHPDRCSEQGADEASQKLTVWKDQFDNGKVFKDDLGEIRTNGYWAEFEGMPPMADWSVENYRLFSQLKEDADKHFFKYLPYKCSILQSPAATPIQEHTYRYEFEKRAIPLSGLVLPQEHVNWVLNRLLEYSAYLEKINFVHGGLTPESVFIVPETHGIQVCSFYHLARIGRPIRTISGKYQHWYPAEMFNTKLATTNIDLEMAKKMAVYLLGEPSGNAVKLRKTHNEQFINFIVKHHESAADCLFEYRDFLAKNFKKEFHLLTI